MPQAHDSQVTSSKARTISLVTTTLFFAFTVYATLVQALDPEVTAGATHFERWSPVYVTLLLTLSFGCAAYFSRLKISIKGPKFTFSRGIFFPIHREIDLTHLTKCEFVTTQQPHDAFFRRKPYLHQHLHIKSETSDELQIPVHSFSSQASTDMFAYLGSLMPTPPTEGPQSASTTVGSPNITSSIQAPSDSTPSEEGVQPLRRGLGRRQTGFVWLFVSLIVLGGSVFYVINTQKTEKCEALAANGIKTTARVEDIRFYKETGGIKYAKHKVEVSSFEESGTIQATVTFTKQDGTSVTELMEAGYFYQSDYKNLYEQLKSGSVEVRYLASDPSTVHPEYSFTFPEKGLCN